MRFDVNVPLLRDRGKDVVAAFETAAKLGVPASLLDLNHTASELIFGAAVRYWDHLASVEVLSVLEDSEQRGSALLENVRTLINADMVPRSTGASPASSSPSDIPGSMRLISLRSTFV